MKRRFRPTFGGLVLENKDNSGNNAATSTNTASVQPTRRSRFKPKVGISALGRTSNQNNVSSKSPNNNTEFVKSSKTAEPAVTSAVSKEALPSNSEVSKEAGAQTCVNNATNLNASISKSGCSYQSLTQTSGPLVNKDGTSQRSRITIDRSKISPNQKSSVSETSTIQSSNNQSEVDTTADTQPVNKENGGQPSTYQKSSVSQTRTIKSKSNGEQSSAITGNQPLNNNDSNEPSSCHASKITVVATIHDQPSTNQRVSLSRTSPINEDGHKQLPSDVNKVPECLGEETSSGSKSKCTDNVIKQSTELNKPTDGISDQVSNSGQQLTVELNRVIRNVFESVSSPDKTINKLSRETGTKSKKASNGSEDSVTICDQISTTDKEIITTYAEARNASFEIESTDTTTAAKPPLPRRVRIKPKVGITTTKATVQNRKRLDRKAANTPNKTTVESNKIENQIGTTSEQNNTSNVSMCISSNTSNQSSILLTAKPQNASVSSVTSTNTGGNLLGKNSISFANNAPSGKTVRDEGTASVSKDVRSDVSDKDVNERDKRSESNESLQNGLTSNTKERNESDLSQDTEIHSKETCSGSVVIDKRTSFANDNIPEAKITEKRSLNETRSKNSQGHDKPSNTDLNEKDTTSANNKRLQTTHNETRTPNTSQNNENNFSRESRPLQDALEDVIILSPEKNNVPTHSNSSPPNCLPVMMSDTSILPQPNILGSDVELGNASEVPQRLNTILHLGTELQDYNNLISADDLLQTMLKAQTITSGGPLENEILDQSTPFNLENEVSPLNKPAEIVESEPMPLSQSDQAGSCLDKTKLPSSGDKTNQTSTSGNKEAVASHGALTKSRLVVKRKPKNKALQHELLNQMGIASEPSKLPRQEVNVENDKSSRSNRPESNQNSDNLSQKEQCGTISVDVSPLSTNNTALTNIHADPSKSTSAPSHPQFIGSQVAPNIHRNPNRTTANTSLTTNIEQGPDRRAAGLVIKRKPKNRRAKQKQSFPQVETPLIDISSIPIASNIEIEPEIATCDDIDHPVLEIPVDMIQEDLPKSSPEETTVSKDLNKRFKHGRSGTVKLLLSRKHSESASVDKGDENNTLDGKASTSADTGRTANDTNRIARGIERDARSTSRIAENQRHSIPEETCGSLKDSSAKSASTSNSTELAKKTAGEIITNHKNQKNSGLVVDNPITEKQNCVSDLRDRPLNDIRPESDIRGNDGIIESSQNSTAKEKSVETTSTNDLTVQERPKEVEIRSVQKSKNSKEKEKRIVETNESFIHGSSVRDLSKDDEIELVFDVGNTQPGYTDIVCGGVVSSSDATTGDRIPNVTGIDMTSSQIQNASHPNTSNNLATDNVADDNSISSIQDRSLGDAIAVLDKDTSKLENDASSSKTNIIGAETNTGNINSLTLSGYSFNIPESAIEAAIRTTSERLPDMAECPECPELVSFLASVEDTNARPQASFLSPETQSGMLEDNIAGTTRRTSQQLDELLAQQAGAIINEGGNDSTGIDCDVPSVANKGEASGQDSVISETNACGTEKEPAKQKSGKARSKEKPKPNIPRKRKGKEKNLDNDVQKDITGSMSGSVSQNGSGDKRTDEGIAGSNLEAVDGSYGQNGSSGATFAQDGSSLVDTCVQGVASEDAITTQPDTIETAGGDGLQTSTEGSTPDIPNDPQQDESSKKPGSRKRKGNAVKPKVPAKRTRKKAGAPQDEVAENPEDEASATSTVQDAQETSTLPKKKRGRPSKKDKQATNAAERTEKNGQEKTPLAEESERKRARRRGNRQKELNAVVNITSMKICDMISYNPVTNPMVPETTNESRTSFLSGPRNSAAATILPAAEDVPDAGGGETTDVCAPRVTIDADGNIVLDEESLVINSTPVADNLDREVVYENANQQYNATHKNRRFDRWQKQETLYFYELLSQIGTDFSLMAKVFPKRSRTELYRKFKREEKFNRDLVDKALTQRLPLTAALFEDCLEETEEEMERSLVVQTADEAAQSSEK